MTNEINRIMDEDPLNLSAQDIDQIIAYHRRLRSDFEAGIKPKKAEVDGIKKLDIGAIMKARASGVLPEKATGATPLKRRF